MRRIIGVKDPTEELLGIYFSLWSWDISLALNMTYFFYLSSRQCQVNKLACKGLRATAFIRHLHFL